MMVTYTNLTEDLWSRLPEVYRREDEKYGGVFKAYVSGMGDAANDIETLINRIAYVPVEEGGEPGDTSDLADSHGADEAWLPWIAMVRGIYIHGTTGESQVREMLQRSSYNSGTKQSLIDFVKPMLSDTQFVAIHPHTGPLDTPSDGKHYELLVVTLAGETGTGYTVDGSDSDVIWVQAPVYSQDSDILIVPDNPSGTADVVLVDEFDFDLVELITANHLRPAGVDLRHRMFNDQASYDAWAAS